MEPTCNVLVMHTKINAKMRLAIQDFQGSKDNRTRLTNYWGNIGASKMKRIYCFIAYFEEENGFYTEIKNICSNSYASKQQQVNKTDGNFINTY